MKLIYNKILSIKSTYYWILFLMLFFVTPPFVYGLDTTSVNFFRNFIQTYFFVFVFFGAVFMPFYVLEIIKNTGLLALMCFGATLISFDWLFKHIGLLNEWTVHLLFPFNFVRASVDEGSPAWAITIILVSFVILFIKNWINDKKNPKPKKNELLSSFFKNGLMAYAFLAVSIWVFTHFTYLGTHTYYMMGNIKYIDKITHVLDEKEENNYMPIHGLHKVKSVDEAIKVIDDYKKYKTNDKIEQIETMKREWIDALNGKNPKVTTYDNMSKFWDWLEIVFNFEFVGYKNNTFWHSSLSVPKEYDYDLARHAMLYARLAPDGSYWLYIELNNNFKGYKQNYFFNFMYLVFHAVFIGLFIWLYSIHKKRLSNKEQ